MHISRDSNREKHCHLWNRGFILGIKPYITLGKDGEIELEVQEKKKSSVSPPETMARMDKLELAGKPES